MSDVAGPITSMYHRIVLAKLTLKLAMLPEGAWPRFAVAHGEQGALPSPLRHAALAGLASALATGLGWATRSGATTGGVVLHVLVAIAGYAGGAVLATWLSFSLLRQGGGRAAGLQLEESRERALVERFASGAILPIALSGLVNIVPFPPLSFVLALAGAASSAHSGWVGASAMLALEGQARKRAAVVPAGLAVSPVLLALFVRMVLPK